MATRGAGGPVALPVAGLPCRFCSAALAGPYCSACGQASVAVWRTLHEALAGQTGRLAHTLRLLVTQPGELAREIDEGRDRASMRPLTLLFQLLAVFFLVSGFTGFGVSAISEADVSRTVAERIGRSAHDATMPPEVFRERLERRFQTAYTVLFPVAALVDGAMIALLHRRWHKPWLVPLAAGIQYPCFAYLWVAIPLAALRFAHVRAYGSWQVLGTESLVNSAYRALLLRRIYDEPLRWAVPKAVGVILTGTTANNALLLGALVVALATA